MATFLCFGWYSQQQLHAAQCTTHPSWPCEVHGHDSDVKGSVGSLAPIFCNAFINPGLHPAEQIIQHLLWQILELIEHKMLKLFEGFAASSICTCLNIAPNILNQIEVRGVRWPVWQQSSRTAWVLQIPVSNGI